jgi:hypothetical protein
MHGMPIRIRVDGDGLDSEAAGGADDTASDLTTIATANWVSYGGHRGTQVQRSRETSLLPLRQSADPARSVQPTHRFAIKILSKRGFF